MAVGWRYMDCGLFAVAIPVIAVVWFVIHRTIR